MRCPNIIILCLSAFLVACQTEKSSNTEIDYAQYVNPFVGTDGPGNTYPGAVVPFGMVQLSPDNGLPGWDRIAGYFWQDSTISGFSHTHLSGTGAGDLYDILVMPTNSRFSEDLWKDKEDERPFSYFSHDREVATVGYYAVDLQSFGIKAELTASERVGMHRYTFPKDSLSAISVDLGYALNWDRPTETYLKLEDEHTITGYRLSTGWAEDQREYFVLKCSKSIKNIQFYKENITCVEREVKAPKTKVKWTFATEEGEEVLLKVALSSCSIEGAKQNLQTEIPSWDFDAVRNLAKVKWNKSLSLIEVKGSEEKKTLFYTNLYHCFLTPSLHSDVSGCYKGADGQNHRAENYKKYDTFSLWDTYRTAHPLYTLIAPEETKDFVSSFLSHYQEIGLLPVWSMHGNETNMMIGYHSVPVIVDAFFKGLVLNTNLAYEACKNTANSNAWNLSEYKEKGYISSGIKWSVSKTLEYAYDDWCVAQFAKVLGKKDDYEYFAKRAGNWHKLFDETLHFFRPKDKNGEFVSPFNPQEYTEDFCESNAWQYLWNVPQDTPNFIKAMGGKKAFEKRLDEMFSVKTEKDIKLPIFSTGMIGQYAHGNEPSHHVAFLYNYVGKPEKTQFYVDKILNNQYSNTPDGYCGNEDCGQMSAWYVMAFMGLYPVNPADGIYQLCAPQTDEIILHFTNGENLQILRKSKEYKRILFNGKIADNYQISHKELLEGGKLVFE